MGTLPKQEQALVAACQRGERRAQQSLYERYARAMLNTAYRIVGDEEEARDVLQDAFVKVFSHLHSYRGESTIGAWIKRIVVNTAIKQVKKRSLPLVDNLEDVQDLPAESSTAPDHLPKNYAQALEAIQKLPPGYRTVLTLYLVEGYDHQEIAQILGIGLSTSLSQYSRAKKKLKAILQSLNVHGQDRAVLPKA